MDTQNNFRWELLLSNFNLLFQNYWLNSKILKKVSKFLIKFQNFWWNFKILDWISNSLMEFQYHWWNFKILDWIPKSLMEFQYRWWNFKNLDGIPKWILYKWRSSTLTFLRACTKTRWELLLSTFNWLLPLARTYSKAVLKTTLNSVEWTATMNSERQIERKDKSLESVACLPHMIL